MAAILLALILYMVWRVAHRTTPDAALFEINTNPEVDRCESRILLRGVLPGSALSNSFPDSMTLKLNPSIGT
jgi:hypothetical protein